MYTRLESEFFDILRGFASLIEPSKFTLLESRQFPAIQDFLLEIILLNPHFNQYPPSRPYQKVFWKWAIQLLENIEKPEDFEIDARIYEHYLTLLPLSRPPTGQSRIDDHDKLYPLVLPLQKPPEPSYITYFWKNPLYLQNRGVSDSQYCPAIDVEDFETITLRESRTTIENGTTGLRTWLASFVLSEYLTKHAALVMGKRVLELGSGIGFLGATVASLQQVDPSNSILWLTDVNEDVLSRCRDNISMPCNKSSTYANVNYLALDWTDSQDSSRLVRLKSLLQDKIDADIILGTDLTFDPSLIPALVEVLHLALQPGHNGSPKMALIAATIRIEETLRQFVQCIERASLQVHEMEFEAKGVTFMQSVDNSHSIVKIFQITVK